MERVTAWLAGRPPRRREVSHVGPVERVRDGVVWDNYVIRPEPGRLGICCSGGGIRSASYNLGALQVLRRRGVLERAEFLSAVSGGSYIAVAHAVMAGTTEDKTLFRDGPPPWAPGSPEEVHLRNHSTYLAPGLVGKLWLLMNVLYGFVVNALPFVAAIFVLARLVGWAYAGGLQPSLRGGASGASIDVAPWSWMALALVGAGFAALGLRRFLERFSLPPGWLFALLQAWSPRLVFAGAAVAIVLLGIPALVLVLRYASEHSLLTRIAPVHLPRFNIPLLYVEVVSLLGALGVAMRVRRKIGWLVPLLATLLGPLTLLVPFVIWVNGAAAGGWRGWSSWDVRLGLAAVAFLVVVGLFGHNIRWSMHMFYKERLSSAFILHRRRRGGRIIAEEPPYERPVEFSSLDLPQDGPGRMPKLVVCASVNVSDDVVPPGRGAGSFTFTQDRSGGPLTTYVDTAELEKEAGIAMVTLPAMMAISGAAVSPAMGKMTRPWLRFLFALFNVRLGVWVRNPLKMTAGARRGPLAAIVRRWREPGPLYVLYEALGLNTLSREFLYVTDGGHWENLGLVELLRRGCTQVLCFDAAGDDLNHFRTLGEAMALARSELDVEIEIDIAQLKPGESGYSTTDHVAGRIRYPDGAAGVLVFAKAAMPADAPWDVKSYHQQDSRFPSHSTSDQFFDDQQFESYRALGAHAARGALRTLDSYEY